MRSVDAERVADSAYGEYGDRVAAWKILEDDGAVVAFKQCSVCSVPGMNIPGLLLTVQQPVSHQSAKESSPRQLPPFCNVFPSVAATHPHFRTHTMWVSTGRRNVQRVLCMSRSWDLISCRCRPRGCTLPCSKLQSGDQCLPRECGPQCMF